MTHHSPPTRCSAPVLQRRRKVAMGPSRDVLLVLCDISGYTRFMAGHAKARTHGFVIIQELLRAVLAEARAPLQVAKLEGDAVFLFCLLDGDPDARERRVAGALDRADRMFRAFDRKR